MTSRLRRPDPDRGLGLPNSRHRHHLRALRNGEGLESILVEHDVWGSSPEDAKSRLHTLDNRLEILSRSRPSMFSSYRIVATENSAAAKRALGSLLRLREFARSAPEIGLRMEDAWHVETASEALQRPTGLPSVPLLSYLGDDEPDVPILMEAGLWDTRRAGLGGTSRASVQSIVSNAVVHLDFTASLIRDLVSEGTGPLRDDVACCVSEAADATVSLLGTWARYAVNTAKCATVVSDKIGERDDDPARHEWPEAIRNEARWWQKAGDSLLALAADVGPADGRRSVGGPREIVDQIPTRTLACRYVLGATTPTGVLVMSDKCTYWVRNNTDTGIGVNIEQRLVGAPCAVGLVRAEAVVAATKNVLSANGAQGLDAVRAAATVRELAAKLREISRDVDGAVDDPRSASWLIWS